jgi:hypothetical protein
VKRDLYVWVETILVRKEESNIFHINTTGIRMMKPVAIKMFCLFMMFSYFLYRRYFHEFPEEELIRSSVTPAHK